MFRYRAFISYCHTDAAAANWLHGALERYRIPRRLQVERDLPPRPLRPIFKDREELSAAGSLSATLEHALHDAEWLIVVCSPAAARSRWVNQEVLLFERLGRRDHILCIIVDGAEGDEVFPPALLQDENDPDGARIEPLAADARRSGDGRRNAKRKLIAALLGIDFDELARRDAARRQKQLGYALAASLAGTLLMAGLALFAFEQREIAVAQRAEAVQQRAVAEREARTAKEVADFLVGIFEIANPATENPRAITALTVLDRGWRRAERELQDQPAIQARLLETVGSVYTNLGLFDRSDTSLRQALAAYRPGTLAAVQIEIALVRNQLLRGNYAAAQPRADTLIEGLASRVDAMRQRADLHGIRARLAWAAGRGSDALSEFNKAIHLIRLTAGDTRAEQAKLLNSAAAVALDLGETRRAATMLDEALRLRLATDGPQHSGTAEVYQNMALVGLATGNLAGADRLMARALAIYNQVLEPDHPRLVTAYTLRGRILGQQARWRDAAAAFRSAVTVGHQAYGEAHKEIAYALVYEAEALGHIGATADALARLGEAERIYDRIYAGPHADRGDLLVYRARIRFRSGNRAAALADCDAGLAILASTVGKADPYFTDSQSQCRSMQSARLAVR